jgi:hypothetical protein
LVAKWDKSVKEMEEKHRLKLIDEIAYFEEMYPKQINFCSKLLSDKKMLEGHLKKEKY